MTSALDMRLGRAIAPISTLSLSDASEPLPVEVLAGAADISPALSRRSPAALRQAHITEYEIANIDELGRRAYERQTAARSAGVADIEDCHALDWLAFRFALASTRPEVERWGCALGLHPAAGDEAMACAAVGFISRGMASHAFLIMQQLEQMPLRMIASACLALRATDVLRRFPTFSAVGAVKAKASRALSEAAMRAGAARVCADLLKPAGSPGRHDAIMNFVSASMPLMRGGELPAAQAACWRQIAAGSHGGVLAAIAILNLGKPPLMALTNAIDPTDDDLALLLQQLRLAKFESSRLSIVIDDLEGIREARALGRQVAAAQTGLSMP